jgi:hypothetical protein
MDTDLFCQTFPRLYHMAHFKALPSIRRHGLLSTCALLDLFEVPGTRRQEIETRMRPASVVITHPVHGKAVVRDQKPIMSDERLEKSLGGTATAAEFHLLLNSKVFFWVSPDRLQTLRNAGAYRGDPQLVLILDCRQVVEAYCDQIMLCPMNSGACKPIAHPRTPAMFQRIREYDFDFWSRRKGGAHKAVVECTVERGVYDIDRFLIQTEIVGDGAHASHCD